LGTKTIAIGATTSWSGLTPPPDERATYPTQDVWFRRNGLAKASVLCPPLKPAEDGGFDPAAVIGPCIGPSGLGLVRGANLGLPVVGLGYDVVAPLALMFAAIRKMFLLIAVCIASVLDNTQIAESKSHGVTLSDPQTSSH